MLHCRQCKFVKGDEHFYESNQATCKECVKARVRENRLGKADYYRAYDRARGNRQDANYLRRYRRENRAKYAAHNAVNNALRDGRLAKPDRCEECGGGFALHGHPRRSQERAGSIKRGCPPYPDERKNQH